RLKLKLEREQAGLEDPTQPAPPASPPLELGPRAGSRHEREQAVMALLQGQVEARRLPVVATDPGVPYNPGLRDRLAPVRYKVSSSPPSSKCNCPPGDPLCSCL
ncbi:MAG TPA: hypothetical protein VNG33_13895, partial [Polyangiaceae bacterium]|nr:hypothetical protein [Polyangiaceae bacterium]